MKCALLHAISNGAGAPQKRQHGQPSKLSLLATARLTSFGISRAFARSVLRKQTRRPFVRFDAEVFALVNE